MTVDLLNLWPYKNVANITIDAPVIKYLNLSNIKILYKTKNQKRINISYVLITKSLKIKYETKDENMIDIEVANPFIILSAYFITLSNFLLNIISICIFKSNRFNCLKFKLNRKAFARE